MKVWALDKKQILFLSSLVSCFIYAYLGYKDAKWSFTGLASMDMNNTLGSNLLWGYSLTSIILLSVYELKSLPIRYQKLILLAVFIGVFWLLIDILSGSFSIWVLKENMSPMYFVFLLIIALGYKSKYWDILIPIIPLFIPIAYIFSYMHLETLFQTSSWLRRPINSGFLTFYLIGFYALMIYSVACKKSIKNLTFIALMILISFYLAFNTWSRSWILHVVLLTCIVILRWVGLRKMKFKYIIIAIAIFLLAILIGSNFIGTNFLDVFEIVEGRKNENTRTWQYVNFFNEVETSDLLIGQGVDASYNSTNFGANYKYIDNVFLLCMFRYGIIPLLLLSYILFKPCKYFLSKNEDLAFACMIVFEWFLIFLGLSTYTTLNYDVATILMLLAIGHCYSLKDKSSQKSTVKFKL